MAILGTRRADKFLEDAGSKLNERRQNLRKRKEELATVEPGKKASKLKGALAQAQQGWEISLAIFDLQSTTRQNLSIHVGLPKQY
jgi:hypothetical protein